MREGRQAYILSTLETLATVHPVSLRVCLDRGEKNSPITSNVLILIRSIKYHLIKKLIAQMETNSRDEIY